MRVREESQIDMIPPASGLTTLLIDCESSDLELALPCIQWQLALQAVILCICTLHNIRQIDVQTMPC